MNKVVCTEMDISQTIFTNVAKQEAKHSKMSSASTALPLGTHALEQPCITHIPPSACISMRQEIYNQGQALLWIKPKVI